MFFFSSFFSDSRLSSVEQAVLATEEPDIGSYNVDQLRASRGAVKTKLLSYRFQPSPGWKGPTHVSGGTNRSCPRKFFNTKAYPTLAYSLSQDGLYCVHCTLFRTTDQQLVGLPYRDWSNAAKFIDKHLKSPDHLKAAGERTQNFIATTTNKQPTVFVQQTKLGEEKRLRTQSAVRSIIATIEVLARQGLAIRGNSDDNSNFMAMLQFRAETDSNLAEHLKKADENMKYTSHRIQNEIVDLLGGQVLSTILTRVKKAGWFSVIADESADISKLEQVALILRYLLDTLDGVTVREDFVSFKSTRDVKGETGKNIIVEQLGDWGLDMNKLVGQGYDGTGNMEGCKKGVRALIQKEYPQAVYVHCKNHNLNLSLRHSTTTLSVVWQ